MSLATLRSVLLGSVIAAIAGQALAADSVCVRNDFEVPWVHPGIAFYATQGDAVCNGPGMTLKKGESGCFDDDAIANDGSWNLLATDATSGDCLVVCALTRSETRIVYSLSQVYACKD